MAITGGAVALTFDAPVWMQIIVCIVIFGATWSLFSWFTARRISKFNQQFPVALELMARATRAGENFEEALAVASRTSEEPLKSEFAQCVQQMQLGHTPHRASEALARRIGTTDTFMLSHALAMHQEVGGRLADSLERLSDIIRERTEFAAKMKSTTGIARFAIAAVTLIGIFVFLYMQAAQPEYISKLLDSRLGRQMVAYGIISELVGLAWVALTLRSEL
jgi:tight adherence protein B